MRAIKTYRYINQDIRCLERKVNLEPPTYDSLTTRLNFVILCNKDTRCSEHWKWIYD